MLRVNFGNALQSALLSAGLMVSLTLGANAYGDDGGWSGAKQIATSPYGDTPVMAVNKRGSAAAVWSQYDVTTSTYSLVVDQYHPDRGWSGGTTIQNGPNQKSFYSVAKNNQGDLIVVWSQYGLFDPANPGVTATLWAERYTAREGWGKPYELQSDGATQPIYTQVAMDDAGDAIVVWQQNNVALDVTNIYAAHFTVRRGWEQPQLIQADASLLSVVPRVAMDPHGNAMAVWTQYDLSNNTTSIVSNRYVGYGWSGPQQVAQGQVSSPQIAVEPEGGALAVWLDFDTTTFSTNVYASHYGVTKGWDSPQDLESSTSLIANSPALAMNGKGDAAAIWEDTDRSSFFGPYPTTIHAARYVRGHGWDAAVAIDDSTTYVQPQVAMDEEGNMMALWQKDNLGALPPYFQPPENVYAYRYDVEKGWGAGELLQTDPTQTVSGAPQVGMSAAGAAVAVWAQTNTTTGDTSVWADHYRPAHP
jgi:hypothetical protein